MNFWSVQIRIFVSKKLCNMSFYHTSQFLTEKMFIQSISFLKKNKHIIQKTICNKNNIFFVLKTVLNNLNIHLITIGKR